MKKIYLFTFLLLNSLVLFSQQVIENELTSEYKEIRGSKIKMIPPKGFVVATSFLGFSQPESNSSVMVLDVPKSFAEVSSGLTNENLLKQGVHVEQSVLLVLNGLPALFIKGEQTAYETLLRKYILVFGTENETIMINGIAPKSDLVLDEIIGNALLSTIYDGTKIITELDILDFEINTVGTDFILARGMTNMLVYNRDGKTPSELTDKASFVIAKAFSKTKITDKKTFAINRIKTLPVQINKINSIVSVEINDLNGFEIKAEGVNRKTGVKEQAYQVMLFDDQNYYILFGSCQGNFKNNLTVFSKLAQSFKLKL